MWMVEVANQTWCFSQKNFKAGRGCDNSQRETVAASSYSPDRPSWQWPLHLKPCLRPEQHMGWLPALQSHCLSLCPVFTWRIFSQRKMCTHISVSDWIFHDWYDHASGWWCLYLTTPQFSHILQQFEGGNEEYRIFRHFFVECKRLKRSYSMNTEKEKWVWAKVFSRSWFCIIINQILWILPGLATLSFHIFVLQFYDYVSLLIWDCVNCKSSYLVTRSTSLGRQRVQKVLCGCQRLPPLNQSSPNFLRTHV